MDFENTLKDMYSNLKIQHDFILGPSDTDSISFCKQDGSEFSEDEQQSLLDEINLMLPKFIVYANDGYFPKCVALKSKNYILYDGQKIRIKGSSLKSSKTEPALKLFMSEVIDCLVFDKQDQLLSIYNKYIKQVNNLTDISPYCSKKTITEAVLNPERSTEQKILDSLKGKHVQQGDKIYVYFTNSENNGLSLSEHWDSKEPNHDIPKLMERIYKTLNIFKNVIKMEQFPRYHLKNKKIKENLDTLLNS